MFNLRGLHLNSRNLRRGENFFEIKWLCSYFSRFLGIYKHQIPISALIKENNPKTFGSFYFELLPVTTAQQMLNILHTSDLLQKSPTKADTIPFLVYFSTYQEFWIFNAIMTYNMGYLKQLNFERHFWKIVPYLSKCFFPNNVLLLFSEIEKYIFLNFILTLKRKTCFCSMNDYIYILKQCQNECYFKSLIFTSR